MRNKFQWLIPTILGVLISVAAFGLQPTSTAYAQEAGDVVTYTVPSELAGILANYMMTAPTVSEVQVPDLPYFGPEGEDIIVSANEALESLGPKSSVYPRVVSGGVYSKDSGRKEFEAAMMAGYKKLYGVTDKWSIFSFPGGSGENGAWFYAMTTTSNDPKLLQTGEVPQVIQTAAGRQEIEMPMVKLDSMMAVNIAMLENMGARDLPNDAGVLSFTLVDGKTTGAVAVAFAVAPQFAHNFTAGNEDLVPAVIFNGMPGAPVSISYYGADGNLTATVDARIEATNGTISVQVPSDGGFVLISVPVRGDNKNANTELIVRMGSQPLSDTPGKNWVASPAAD